ncbi:hypothetical protein GCM10027615_08300 [Plantactinospora veratri]
MPEVFADLVGQPEAVDLLRRAVAAAEAVRAAATAEAVSADRTDPADPAVGGDRAAGTVDPAGAGSAMTHAWIFTGPPGSGRSVAARAFAAALQCHRGTGCGECAGCHTTLAGTHADVRFVVPEGLSIGVGEMRALVLRAASTPSGGRWQVLVIEDADRLTEAAGNALLKAIEEPPPRTVFLLCTPSTHPDDISVTIRSRCRVVTLRQPPAEAVAAVLRDRDGIASDVAAWAAAAAQGHVGRARRLARDPEARKRREAVLALPRKLTGVGACFDAASALIEAAEAEAAAAVAEADATERAALETALGAGGPGGARRARSGAPPGSSRTSNAGRSPGPPGPSGTRWTGPWSTWPGSTGTYSPSRCAPRSSRCTPTWPGSPARPPGSGAPRAPCAGWRRYSAAVRRSRPTSSHGSPSRR